MAERVEHLRGGLDKLNEATSEVDKLSKSATEQRALLTQKQEEADVAMEQIQKSMERAVERKGEVEMLQKKLGKEEVQMTERKGGVEEELSKIAPVLEAAKAAVGGIKSDNLNEIRSLKMPPEAIRDVLEGVLRIMGNYDTSGISMKRFTPAGMGKSAFMMRPSRWRLSLSIRAKPRLGMNGNGCAGSMASGVSTGMMPSTNLRSHERSRGVNSSGATTAIPSPRSSLTRLLQQACWACIRRPTSWWIA